MFKGLLVLVLCRQHLCVDLLVIIPVIVPCRQHLYKEILVIIPVIVPSR